MRSKPRILVVDDEEIIRLGCQRILNEEHYEVLTAENGKVALALVKERSPDLMLVDLLMPELGGMEVLEKVHQHDKNIVTIVITGYATIESAVEAVKKGAFDYLPKPFGPEELRAVVLRGLERRRLLLETERLRRERERNLLELAAERSRTATIIHSMGEGLLVVNRQRQVVLLNPVAQKILHLHEAQVVGKPVEGHLAEKQLEDFIISALTHEEPRPILSRKEIPLERRPQEVLAATLSPILSEKGEMLGVVVVLRDITDQKRVERSKSDFVRMVAHELKAPLGAIEGYLNLLIDGMVKDDPAREREIIVRCRDRAEALLGLIRDLLDLSAIEAGKVAQEMQPIEISSILQEVVEMMNGEARARNVSMELRAASRLPKVVADREDLMRVFTNLVSNAIKYNRPGGRVSVAAHQENSHVVVEVTDTGFGIPPEEQSRIFDEFYRVKNEHTRNICGTGLGLAIAKRIVESHRGYIEVQSRPEEGSTFAVHLPMFKA
ncbi:MAG: response regulator [candidate division KSB1 bacterium]|nr:response regulator [candidate division KSB1 bacterium]MDZ7337112.1 response regulator [candidate division KSB1 bacterium]MDZ7385939.1 response regulator [candidate division KSB1 bacterium]MDZ7393542.1 response regulator [candidate division KSB1 bacterium]MDZ7412393.1 response regulator [candidate division KSB1 bacterium]